MPDALRRARVPQLLLQPLVENAIRHGLAPREEPGLVHIAARQANGTLHIDVIDDGVGIGPGQVPLRPGIGLSATRERLQHMYGARHSLDIQPAQPRGTIVSVELPWHETQS